MFDGPERLTYAIELHKKQCSNRILQVKNDIESRLRSMMKVYTENITKHVFNFDEKKIEKSVDLNAKIGMESAPRCIPEKNSSQKENVLTDFSSAESSDNRQQNIAEIKNTILSELGNMNKKITKNSVTLSENSLDSEIILPRIVSVTDIRRMQMKSGIEKNLRGMYKHIIESYRNLIKKNRITHCTREKKMNNQIVRNIRGMNHKQFENIIHYAKKIDLENKINFNFRKMHTTILKNLDILVKKNIEGGYSDIPAKKNIEGDSQVSERLVDEINGKIRNQIQDMKKTIDLTENIYTNTFLQSVFFVLKEGSIKDDQELISKITESIEQMKNILNYNKKINKDEVAKATIYLGITEKYVKDIIKIREVCDLFRQFQE